MTSFSTMQRPQQELPSTQQSRSYGHYLDSNPSSTHSSPRTYPSDLEPYYPSHPYTSNLVHSQTYPIPAGVSVNPYNPARRPYPQMQASRSSSYSSYTAPVPLQVSTSTSSTHEHDPNERTARPGNAHVHAQFHSSLSATMPSSTAASSTTSLSSTSNSFSSASATTVGPASRTNADPADDVSGGQQDDYMTSTPGLSAGLTRPLKPIEQERLAHLDRLKFFLATAPSRWDSAASNADPGGMSSSGVSGEDFGAPYTSGMGGYPGSGGGFSGLGMGLEPAYHHAPPHPALNRFLLPNQEFVTCVLWNGLYHITGTDIVRALVFRFEAFGRPVRNMKKFEEGVFSDLRNLKPGVDACLEEPKSPFLDLLFKYQCIRTQKKQKVFYWFSVPHDRLFLDALERDLKREKMGLEPTTQIIGEPALSFTYDPKRSLYEQFSKAQGAREGEGELETAIRIAEKNKGGSENNEAADGGDSAMQDDSEGMSEVDDAMTGDDESRRKTPSGPAALQGPNGQQFLQLFTLFEGSPTYKQRRKKGVKSGSGLNKGGEDFDDYERGRSVSDSSSMRFSSQSQSRERRHRLPIPTHPSMRDEFGPNSEQPHTTEPMSAAEMFLLQAGGKLAPADGSVRKPKPQPMVGEVGVFYSEGAPPGQQSSGLGHIRGRSFDGMIRESTQPRPSGTSSAGYTATTFAEAQAQSQSGQQTLTTPGPMATGMAQYEAVSADGKVRAFVCPLYSCGRLFKRMEHLKRHLRTHTMERPFSCPRCNKKFSRSDNLTQHLRTHERTGHGPSPGNATGGNEWMDGADDADASGEGSASGGSPRGGGIADSDDDGGIHGMPNFHPGGMGMEMFGDSGALGMMSMGGLDMSAFGMLGAGVAGFPMGNLDAQMCEVEVQGGVQDVQGDEEGLLMRTGGVDSAVIYRNPSQSDGYFSSLPSSASTSGMLFSAANSGDFADSSQWVNRPQPSPAYSAVSAPSPPPGSNPLMRNSNLRNMQHHSHSSSSSASSAYGDDYSSASLSAPSHKQSFDHSTLYPPGILENAVPANSSAGNVGPTRRHRSMTPSLIRNGEPIRRPMTSNSGEFQGANNGSPGSIHSSVSSSSAAPRGYHPYAYSASNSRANSTHSSPQVHPIPLGAEYAQVRRSESRSSSYSTGASGLHDQMRQMMNMNLDQRDASAPPNSSGFADGIFRTDSPASFHQTESPPAFNMDLPLQYPETGSFIPTQPQSQPLHSSSMPIQYGMTQSQQQYDGYYNPQPHATI